MNGETDVSCPEIKRLNGEVLALRQAIHQIVFATGMDRLSTSIEEARILLETQGRGDLMRKGMEP